MAMSRFHALLQTLIEGEIERATRSVVSGQATDFSVYREEVGYLRGLRAALELCDQVEAEME